MTKISAEQFNKMVADNKVVETFTCKKRLPR